MRKNLEKKKVIAVILGDPCLADPVKRDQKFNPEDLEAVGILKAALAQLKAYKFSYLDNHRTLYNDLKVLAKKIWLVLNLCDEGYMNHPCHEDGIPIFLEKLGLPYTGCGPRCMRECYDKLYILQQAESLGVKIPYIYESPKEIKYFPVIIKPRRGDGGLGINARSVCNNQEQADFAFRQLQSQASIIQEFLSGKDLSIGIIGNSPTNFIILPIIEDDYSELPKNLPPIAGYESKWLPESPYWQKIQTKEADLPQKVSHTMVAKSIMLFSHFACCDYARFDWRLDALGQPRLLEINPNPGWCHDGHLAKMCTFAGMRYSHMLEAIILAAIDRLGLK